MKIQMTQQDVEVVLAESPRFRSVIASLVEHPSESDVEKLKNTIRTIFSNSSKIPAIKYVRQWAVDNNYENLKSLTQSKQFVESLLPPGY